jgi:PPM family protein phosphatase
MRFTVGHATDMGRVRERNEDSVLIDPPLYVVADGMGGHRGGDVASQLAVETMERLAGEDRGSLVDHVRRANRAVWDRSVEDQRLSGMGTTLTAAKVDGSSVLLAHVGDSRAYLMRDGSLQQLTDDHTLVARMVKSGEITQAEADVHPHKNVMTRALGTDQDVEVDERSVTLVDGDRLLLCSDGLTGMVTEDQIQAILQASPDPQTAADRLVRAANRAGGVDNISVVVLDAIGEGDEATGRARSVVRPSRRTLARWGIRLAIVAIVLVALLVGARVWLDRQWYVGPDHGRVAVFQGIPLTVLGFELSSPEIVTDLPASEVRKLEQYEKFDEGITAADRDEALGFIDQIEKDLRAAREAERKAAASADGNAP